MQSELKTGLERLEATADEDIDLSDSPELGPEFFSRAVRRGPLIEKDSVLIDSEIYAWFKSQGPDFRSRINAVLREHIEASKTLK